MPLNVEASALAFSPDGKWFALANRREQIFLVDRASRHVQAEIEGGEWTSTVLFDPTSRFLASACSFQGGGHVRVDRISSDGQLIPLYELGRSNFSTPPEAFVDSLIHLAFSPNGQWLALFESSRIYHNYRPAGWRGNMVLYAVETGELQWQATLDAQGTSDHRTLAEAGYPTGFFTELLFVDNAEIACGATQGMIVCYNVATGKLTRRLDLHTDAAVRSLALDTPGKRMWVVLSDGKLVWAPL